jgi:hypothetical protein
MKLNDVKNKQYEGSKLLLNIETNVLPVPGNLWSRIRVANLVLPRERI